MELNDLVTKADLQSLKMELLVELSKLMKPKSDDRKNALTFRDACDYLQMPASTLRAKVRSHEIASAKIGKQLRFLVKDLDNYLYLNRRKTDAEIRSLIA